MKIEKSDPVGEPDQEYHIWYVFEKEIKGAETTHAPKCCVSQALLKNFEFF